MKNDEIDRSLIGAASEPFRVEVEKGAIRKFAEAIGDADPRYRDEEAARRAGFPTIIAPPTFAVTFRPPVEPTWTRNLDRRRFLAGGQRFQYGRPILAGDRLLCRMRFVGVEEKVGQSGPMLLLHQEMRGEDAVGNIVFVNSRSIIYRARAAK